MFFKKLEPKTYFKMILNNLMTICLVVLVLYNKGGVATKIVERPNDVMGSECGSEIRMTCVARSKVIHRVNKYPSALEIKWWFRNTSSSVTSSKEVEQLNNGDRMVVEIEEYYVVRSTLIIRGAEFKDEGVYQCRASNHPQRHKPGLQYWKIEEAPVADVKCSPPGGATTEAPATTTHTTPLKHLPNQKPTTPSIIKEETPAARPNITEKDDGKINVVKVVTSYPQALTSTQSFATPNTGRGKVTGSQRKSRQARRSSASTKPNGTGAGWTAYHSISVTTHLLCALMAMALT